MLSQETFLSKSKVVRIETEQFNARILIFDSESQSADKLVIELSKCINDKLIFEQLSEKGIYALFLKEFKGRFIIKGRN